MAGQHRHVHRHRVRVRRSARHWACRPQKPRPVASFWPRLAHARPRTTNVLRPKKPVASKTMHVAVRSAKTLKRPSAIAWLKPHPSRKRLSSKLRLQRRQKLRPLPMQRLLMRLRLQRLRQLPQSLPNR